MMTAEQLNPLEEGDGERDRDESIFGPILDPDRGALQEERVRGEMLEDVDVRFPLPSECPCVRLRRHSASLSFLLCSRASFFLAFSAFLLSLPSSLSFVLFEWGVEEESNEDGDPVVPAFSTPVSRSDLFSTAGLT